MNVAIVRGHVLSVPNERCLGTGEFSTAFDVVTENESGRLTVPVNWVTPVKALIVEGDDVVVVGKVRRRFFQSGGAVQSRTELLAESVIAARRKVAARKAVDAAVADIRRDNRGI